MAIAPRVAISQEFLLELGKQPSSVHARVVKWMLKFQQNPMAPGIHYENIKGARDRNLRSVRIDQDWRGILFKPDQGDLFILLHLGHHDEAYRWAENRRLSINPATGALQVVMLDSTQAAPPKPDAGPEKIGQSVPPLFAEITDEQLVRLGTPVELLPLVRGIHDEAELDGVQAQLPVEAYEGLFLLMAGDSVDAILSERQTRIDRQVDTTNFAAALEEPESQSRFVVVTDDRELAAILNAPLAQWRVFLHPTQRKLAVGDRSGPVRILGGAGTGKTVLAMHRAKWLVQDRTADNLKVLFVTFTHNLALDIAHNMKSLLPSPESAAKLEVTNLDRWVHAYLRGKSYEQRIVYGLDPDAWGKALQVADSALGLDDAFYADEWARVVAAQGIRDLDAYRRVSRLGRGTVLSRAKRDRIWPVFEEYRALLASRKLKDVDDAYGDAAQLLAQDQTASRYAAIVVDETQDLGPQALRLLRVMIPKGVNDLFFVGDGHQRIYGKHRAVMSHSGIDIRGRSRKLYLNYRTTEEIRRAAVALLEGRDIDDLDGGSDDNRRYKSLSHGPEVNLVGVPGLDAAIEMAVKQAQLWCTDATLYLRPSICLMTFSNAARDKLMRALSAKGIEVRAIDADSGDTDKGDAVRISTMHRAKGLEFDRVVVAAAGLPHSLSDLDMARLVYVALTRAKSMAMLLTDA